VGLAAPKIGRLLMVDMDLKLPRPCQLPLEKAHTSLFQMAQAALPYRLAQEMVHMISALVRTQIWKHRRMNELRGH